ncbi:MAG: hypothetical protein ACKVRP_06800 [Bacteroidota bacterium]
MAKLTEDIQEMIERSKPDTQPRPLRVEPQRKHIYGGDPQRKIAGYAVPQNRKGVRRRRSTFNIIAAIFGSGVAIVLYISNILAVNKFADDVSNMQLQLDKLVGANQILRAEIDRKSRWERIGRIAAEELGLEHPDEQPKWFDVEDYSALAEDQ